LNDKSRLLSPVSCLLSPIFRLLFSFGVGCLGLSAFLTQVTLMRELLGVFAGNELVFGIALGAWLLLTGIGSSLGRLVPRLARPLDAFLAAQVALAAVPVADVYLLRTLRNVVFLRGAAVGVTETVLSCLVLLAPYCLLTGFLLTLASAIFDRGKDSQSIGEVYSLDNVGAVAGGLLFSLVLVTRLNHFQILYVPALANLLLACLLAWLARRRLLAVIAAAATASLAAAAIWGNLDRVSLRILYAGQEVVDSRQSPYGNLVVTEASGQYSFWENGIPLFSTGNVAAAEEMVHYAMAQRPDAKRVLLISGGVAGAVSEALKYHAAVDYVELDPAIVEAAKQVSEEIRTSLADPRVEFIPTDGRLFVRQSDRQYDLVLINLPDPSTSQINRLYTWEFFAEVKRRLSGDGVLSFSLGEYANYLRPELEKLVAVARRTLQAQFRNVLVLPTDRLCFLASDGPLTTDVASRLRQHAVSTQWLSESRLGDTLSASRTAVVARPVAEQTPINRDFSPVLYYYHLRDWMSQFQVRLGILEGLLLVVFGLFLVRLRPVGLAVFTTGLAASALELVLLLGFQVLFGSLYRGVGLIVTMFMLGLGIGSLWMNRVLARRGRRDLAILVFAVAGLAACLPAGLASLGRLPGGPALSAVCQAAIYVLTWLLGALVGSIFPLAGKIDFQSVSATASRLYTADYLGAALGALLVSTWLIPLMGVTAVCWLIAGLNVLSGGVLVFPSRERK